MSMPTWLCEFVQPSEKPLLKEVNLENHVSKIAYPVLSTHHTPPYFSSNPLQVEARDDGYTAPELRLKMWRFSEQRQRSGDCHVTRSPVLRWLLLPLQLLSLRVR